jgi:hypothetical protein
MRTDSNYCVGENQSGRSWNTCTYVCIILSTYGKIFSVGTAKVGESVCL